jgi:hypothetical protein
MNCNSCHRPIKPGEPIWADYYALHPGYVRCEECSEKPDRFGWRMRDWLDAELQCGWCGRTVHTRTCRDKITCSSECQRLYRQRRNRENMRVVRKEAHEIRARFSGDAPAPSYCLECSAALQRHPVMKQPRRDSRYCSAKCKQRAYRRRLI